jgi:hypothetical protein
MALRYLLDENLRGPVRAALERANAARKDFALEIACVGEEIDLPLGAADEEILRWAEQHGFVLVSTDLRTMPQHLATHLKAGLHCPGVFLVALPCSIPDLLEALFYFADDPAESQWRDQITFIP